MTKVNTVMNIDYCLSLDSGESVSFIEKSNNSLVSMEILGMLPMPLVKKMLVLSDMSEISKAQSK